LVIDGFAGITAMDCSVADDAVNTLEPMIELKVAVILLVPLAATAVARPPEVMVATEGVAEAHVTRLVMLGVVPSL
jgi:hypothetical protein